MSRRTGRLLITLATFVATLVAASCTPVVAPRNVRIATWNTAFVPGNDGDFFDDGGQPLSNTARAGVIAQRILESGVEIIALNEVFDEAVRDILSSTLDPTYRYHVDYIGDDADLSDSGLMIFSMFPFETMALDDTHLYDCGDVEIRYNGTASECSDDRLGFSEFSCGEEYDGDVFDGDCVASKGVALVKIALPFKESLYVGFSHFVASYPDDDEITACAKTRDRRIALNQFRRLAEDAFAEAEGAWWDARVVLLGDLNIDGNPHRPGGGSSCLLQEWDEVFSSGLAIEPFTSCADNHWTTCQGEDRILTDAWAFTTSEADLGRTNGFDFSLDLGDPDLRSLGERLDYVAIRGPANANGGMMMLIPQHLSIAWPMTGTLGNLSDHLPLAVDMLFQRIDTTPPPHTTPRTHELMIVSPGPDATVGMSITEPGQMQWLTLEGEPGTYTLRVSSGSGQKMGMEIYQPWDLSRPVEPRREAEDGGWVWLLSDPPYYIRTWVVQNGTVDTHDRVTTPQYTVQAHRHDCTSPQEACILTAGKESETAFSYVMPALNSINGMAPAWFEFTADDVSDPSQPDVTHDLAIVNISSDVTLPAFTFEALDRVTQAPLQDVHWDAIEAGPLRRQQRAAGIAGSGSAPQSWADHLLRVTRDPSTPFQGRVAVVHLTNLVYATPLKVAIHQEYDDSAHDELLMRFSADGNTFHESVTPTTIHQHVGPFVSLPQIDELEDGGSWWPATSTFGTMKATRDLPILMVEDNDEDGDPEFGDYLLASPASGNRYRTANGRAAALPLDEIGGHAEWIWSDDPDESDPDDTDYWYTLSFTLTHCPPGRLCE